MTVPALVPDHASEIIHAATITAWILSIYLWVVRGWFGKVVFDNTVKGWFVLRVLMLLSVAISELFVFGFAISLIIGTIIQFGFINYVLEATGCPTAITGFTEYNFVFYSYGTAAIVVFALFYASPLRIFKKNLDNKGNYQSVGAVDDELGAADPNEVIETGGMQMFNLFLGLASGKYDHMESTMTAFPARVYAYVTGVLYVFTISAATSEFRRRYWTAFLAGGFGFTLASAFAVTVVMHLNKTIGLAKGARAIHAASLYRDITMSMLCMAVVYLGIYIWASEPGGSGNDDGTWWTRACGSDYMSYGERTGFSLLVPIGPFVTAGVEYALAAAKKRFFN